MKCKTCKKEVDSLDLFSTKECLECYEKSYEKLSQKEKIPNFIKTIKQ